MSTFAIVCSRWRHRSTNGVRYLLTAAAVLLSFGCSSPTQPNVSVVAAKPLAPPTGALISYYSQPVTISLAAGTATGGTATTTIVDVAADAAFAANVRTQAATPDAAGHLTVVLDHLNPATYYWRASTKGGSQSAVSSVASFTIGPQLAIQPPAPIQPLPGSFVHKRPTLAIANALRTASVAMLSYRFDIANDAAFTNVVAGGTVAEGSSQTLFTPSSDLVSGTTYYWRARATDASTSTVSPYSNVQSFTTVNPDDGLFRYLLTLHLVSATNCYPVLWRLPSDVTFDSGLTVSGDHLQYAVEYNYSTVLTLDVHRTSPPTGALRAEGLIWPGMIHLGVFVSATLTSGSVDVASGRLTGTARGVYSDEGFPAHIDCANAEIAFTLAPHP